MKVMENVNINLQEDDNIWLIKINNNMSLDKLKSQIRDFLSSKLLMMLDNLVLEEGILIRNQTIVIYKNGNIFEQYAKNRFTYFKVDDKEILINKIERRFFYSDEEVFYDSNKRDSITLAKVVNKIIDLLNYLLELHNDDKFSSEVDFLYIVMQIVNDNKMIMVCDNQKIALMLPRFYQVSNEWMKMDIVLKETKEIIGCIEFNFKDKKDDYYDYKGNVSYEIKDIYRGFGYATLALKLLKLYLVNQEIADKELYVSVEENNLASQKVAINNEGILCYDGEVPKTSPLRFLAKVSKVKIYRIENM